MLWLRGGLDKCRGIIHAEQIVIPIVVQVQGDDYTLIEIVAVTSFIGDELFRNEVIVANEPDIEWQAGYLEGGELKSLLNPRGRADPGT